MHLSVCFFSDHWQWHWWLEYHGHGWLWVALLPTWAIPCGSCTPSSVHPSALDQETTVLSPTSLRIQKWRCVCVCVCFFTLVKCLLILFKVLVLFVELLFLVWSLVWMVLLCLLWCFCVCVDVCLFSSFVVVVVLYTLQHVLYLFTFSPGSCSDFTSWLRVSGFGNFDYF